MFRALQHYFGLLPAFSHQQHNRKCSNIFEACHHSCERNGWRTVAKSKSALRCLLTCPPPHLPDMFVQNWVDVEARRKSDAKSTFYDHFLQSRSKVPEKAPSNWQIQPQMSQMFGAFSFHLPNLAASTSHKMKSFHCLQTFEASTWKGKRRRVLTAVLNNTFWQSNLGEILQVLVEGLPY